MSVAFGGYRVDGVLGRGGFSVVYRAFREDGRAAAIKLAASMAARDSIVREGDMLERIEQLGIAVAPALLGRGELADGRPWLALALVEGRSLDQERAAIAGSRVSSEEASWTALAIARAVESLHAHAIVHGDLKPANIFVAADRRSATLIDFGADAEAGTAAYMAPEQCDGRGSVLASDIYALGVIVYALVAGRSPFDGTTAVELKQAHVARRPPPLPSDVPAPFEQVIRSCLAKAPADRPTATELVAALERSLQAAKLETTTSRLRVVSPSPAAEGSPSSRAAAASRERVPGELRRMGILALEPRCDATRLERLLHATGGRIAHVAASRAIAVFDSDASRAPFARLVRAAQTLAREGAIARGIAGVADVRVHQRRGREVVLSAAFADAAYDPARVPAAWLGILPSAEHLVDVVPAVHPQSELVGLPLDDELYRSSSMTIAVRAQQALVGRDELIDELAAACGEALAARTPAVHVLVGEPGVGKSALVGALLERIPVELVRAIDRDARAIDRAACVHAWRAPDAALSDPYELVARMLRTLLELPQRAPADGGAALFARIAGDGWPAVALALGWLPPTSPALAPVSAAGSLRAELASALASTLVERARTGELVVLLDDAHLADDVVLDAIEAATLPERAVPLVAIAVGTAAPAHRSWGRRAARFATHTIAPLPDAAAHALVRQLLHPVEHVPSDAVERIGERARGLPRLVHEIVRGLRADGAIRVEPATQRAYLVLDRLDDAVEATSVDWIAERELRALPPALAAHARLVASLGGAFTLDDVAGTIANLERAGHGELVPLDPRVGVERLVEAGLVLQVGRDRWDVRFPLLRDAIERTCSDTVRQLLHAAAYAHHAGTGDGATSIATLSRLARHAERAGDPALAIEPLLALGRQANARHLYLLADVHATRALGLLAVDDPRRLGALRDRGIARYRLGRYADALSDLRAARTLAIDPIERCELLLDEAMALDWMVDYGPAREAVELAEHMLRASDATRARVPDELRVRLLVGRGRSELRNGALSAAVELLEEARRRAETIGEAAYESRIVALLMLAPVLAMLGRTDESAALFAEATAVCESHRDRMHLVSVIQNQIPLYMARHDHAGAVAVVDRARTLSRDLGLIASEHRQLANLADIQIQAGQATEALATVERTAALAALVHGDPWTPDVSLLQARALVLAGRFDEARAAVRRAAAARDSMGAAEHLLVDAIELATSPYDRAAWQALVDRCEHLSGQSDVVEVLDLAHRAASAAGDVAFAAIASTRFAAMADSTPCFYKLRSTT